MEVIDGALEETYSDGSKVKYDASDISCSCSAFKNFQAPCIHILFIRERASTTDENMDIFKVENFHERFKTDCCCPQLFPRFQFSLFNKLFGRLLERIPAIVIRALCFSYKEQLGWVKWGRDSVSETFGIKNGTR